jgi:hypothetical protein
MKKIDLKIRVKKGEYEKHGIVMRNSRCWNKGQKNGSSKGERMEL